MHENMLDCSKNEAIVNSYSPALQATANSILSPLCYIQGAYLQIAGIAVWAYSPQWERERLLQASKLVILGMEERHQLCCRYGSNKAQVRRDGVKDKLTVSAVTEMRLERDCWKVSKDCISSCASCSHPEEDMHVCFGSLLLNGWLGIFEERFCEIINSNVFFVSRRKM